jgi:hypothetical protein
MLTYLVSRIIVNVLGSLYPGYMSYKAIKNKDRVEHVSTTDETTRPSNREGGGDQRNVV